MTRLFSLILLPLLFACGDRDTKQVVTPMMYQASIEGLSLEHCDEAQEKSVFESEGGCKEKLIVYEDLLYLEHLKKMGQLEVSSKFEQNLHMIVFEDAKVVPVEPEKVSSFRMSAEDAPLFFPSEKLFGGKDRLREHLEMNPYVANLSSLGQVTMFWDQALYQVKTEYGLYNIEKGRSVLRLSKSLFNALELPNFTYMTAESNKIFRLSQYVYALAQNEGDRVTLGLPCPELHPLNGQMACEKKGKGPVQAQIKFILGALGSCGKCGPQERRFLNNYVKSLEQRIIEGNPKVGFELLELEVAFNEAIEKESEIFPLLGELKDVLRQELKSKGRRPRRPFVALSDPDYSVLMANYEVARVHFYMTHPIHKSVEKREKERKERLKKYFSRVQLEFGGFQFIEE